MSSSKRALALTREAEDDLVAILVYSEQVWGSNQADRYAEIISQAFDFIARQPFATQTRDDIGPGVRGHVIEGRRHVVYFKIDDNVVRVLRVLHVRMNPQVIDWSEE